MIQVFPVLTSKSIKFTAHTFKIHSGQSPCIFLNRKVFKEGKKKKIEN